MTHAIGHFEKVRALAAGPRLLAVGGTRTGVASQVTLYDHVANKPARTIDVPAHVLGLAFAGEQLAAACADGALRIYDAASGALAIEIAAHAGGALAVAASPDGQRIATAGADGALRLWGAGAPAALGAALGAFRLSSAPLRAVAFDPAGELCAAAGDDGTARVITLATGAQRDMPGHDGPVLSLAFTPRDGRLASGGEDGTVRVWYLVGEVEHELRGADGNGHPGGVLALLFPPSPPEQDDGNEPGDKLLSAGADGKIRVWRLSDRRKPRSLDGGGQPVHALAFAPASSRREGLGAALAGGDRRTVLRFSIDASGTPSDRAAELAHGLDVLSQGLGGARPARETAVKALAALDEPEALAALLRVLRSDRDAEVRALAASLLGERGRRAARAKLREALDDGHAAVRAAAFDALRAIDRDAPLSPLRAGLEARAADIQCKALAELAKLAGTSPLIPGLIAEKLSSSSAPVRFAALSELSRLRPQSPEPLRTAFERGPSDLRVEVLIQATMAGWLSSAELSPLVARALDDDDAEVRRVAFAAKVAEQRALAHVLEAKDPDLARAVRDIARRIAQVQKGLVGALAAAEGKAQQAQAKVTDQAIEKARASIPGVGEPGAEPADADLSPLLTAMACRTPDTAVRGARGLAQLGDTRALGALLQLTREPDPALRRQAAAALQELQDHRAVKRLVWMLDDGDASVRAAALDAFSRIQDTPLAVAEAALRSSHEDIRIRGLDRLVKVADKGAGGHTPEAELLLADAIEDEAPKVRGEAFRTLWSWHAKDPERALDRALEARFPDLRLRAVEELKAQGEHAWAKERLQATIGDRDAAVAQAAYDAIAKIRGKGAPEPHLAAMGSVHATVRAAGARGAARAGAGETFRSPLLKLLEDREEAPRTAAIEALDKLLPGDAGPIRVGLQSSHLDLRVRAAELCAARHDDHLVDPMRALLADKTLLDRMPREVLRALRMRAATALATLGSTRLVKYFATELLKDEHPEVREQAARGLAMAARRGDEGYLLDAMGHGDVAVRSWAADGLSRLGDVRALPVLTGTLRHEHPPIRVATIMSFAALGPEGYGGMLQGLEDPAREVQEIVFAIVLARDLRAFRRREAPDLLTSALSSQRSDIRFAAARGLELRTDPEAYMAHLIEVLTPPRPEKAADMKDWPPEEARGRLLVGLAEALAGDDPEQRYAAAQVLRLRRKPLDYFREAKRVAQVRRAGAPIVADTTPRRAEEGDTTPAKGWLRRLFARDDAPEAERPPSKPPPPAQGVGGLIRRLLSGSKEPAPAQPAGAQAAEVPETEQRRLRWLAFGAYMGLLRQVAPGDDEGHRVRRDAIDRIVDLCEKGHVSATAAVPPLVRALDDPHHLVRKAAFAGLRALFGAGAREPLALGLASASADVARAALDELAGRGDAARPDIVRALSSPIAEVRRYAFELLERLSPKGSLDPLLAALGSEHADLRLGVLERLATSSDARIVPALCRAMESDHDDLRLRAAELLARRRDDRAVDVLATFLRSDQAAPAARAREALVGLASEAAVRALAARLEEATAPSDRVTLVHALGGARSPKAVAVLAARFDDEAAEVRSAAFQAALSIAEHHGAAAQPAATRRRATGKDRERRDPAMALRFLAPAARARDAALRLSAARELDVGDDPAHNDLLIALFADRDVPTRVAAVASFAQRVIHKGAPVEPLEAVVRAGARELLLAAAEGVASRGLGSALRPLLLFVRAGEPGERERALLSLGALGDPRALAELSAVAAGGTKEAPVELSMQAAATEALGRIAGRLSEPDARKRAADRVEQSLDADALEVRIAAARGVRWLGGERARALLERIVRATDAPDRLRATAVAELGELGDAGAELTLAWALDAWSYDVRSGAREALEKLFPEDRTRMELLSVGSRHDDIAGPAATYLATEADPAELLPRLGDLKDAGLRARLTKGLSRRASLPAGALAKLLGHDRPAARKDAAWLIAARTGAVAAAEGAEVEGPAPLPEGDRAALAAALAGAERRTAERWAGAHGEARREEAAAWRIVVWASARVDAVAAVPALRSLAVGEGAGDASPAPPEIRREAARALATLGAADRAGISDTTAALTAALKDMDPGVRAAAAASLAALAPAAGAQAAAGLRPFDAVAFGLIARAAAPASRAALLADEAGRRMALPAVIAAGESEPLLSLASGRDAEAQQGAIAALGRIGDERAIQLLGSLAFDKKAADLALRKAAYRAYRRAKRREAKARADRERGATAQAGDHGAEA